MDGEYKMMKKIVSMVVMMLFVLSIVQIVVADEGYEEYGDMMNSDRGNYEGEMPDPSNYEGYNSGDYEENSNDYESHVDSAVVFDPEMEERNREMMDDDEEEQEQENEDLERISDDLEDDEGKDDKRKELKEDLREIRDGFKEGMNDRREEFNQDMKEKRGEFKEEMRERVSEGMSEEDREKMKEAQEKFKEMRKEYNHKFKEIKEEYKERKDSYHEYRDELSRMKEEAKECSEDECAEKKTELKRGVKKHLLKTGDLIGSSLQKLLNRIEASEGLTDEEKEEATTKLKALEETLEAKQAEVEALADGATSEEVRKAIQGLKKTWQDVRKMQRRVVASLTNAKQEKLVEKHDRYYDSMQSKIDKLAEQGVDTSELEELLQKFASQTEELKDDHQTTKDRWQEAIDEEGRERYKEAQEEVREDLKQSKEILREFVSEFKELKRETTE